jgi:uncharacterized protein YajQ (UPF0234 family)
LAAALPWKKENIDAKPTPTAAFGNLKRNVFVPSFDAVSKVDSHELTNAVDQARRELEKRYDLRGTGARFELEGMTITQFAASEYQLEQMLAKKLVAELKAAKLKVDAQIQGDKLRVNGKKRDDLQLAMALLRKAATELPLQFENFRD